jgi:signal peptidase II
VLAVIIAICTVALDQLTKMAVAGSIPLGAGRPVIGDFFRLRHIRNSGAVFGIMRGAGQYFTVFSVLAAGVLVLVIYFSRGASRMVRISLGLVLGGAIGNLIDRLRFGEVVDFMDLGFGGSRWPCFNIADAAITVGVVLLIVHSLSESMHHGEPAESDHADPPGPVPNRETE